MMHRFCQKCGTPVTPEAKRKSWIRWMSFYIGVVIILPIIMYFVDAGSADGSTKNGILAGLVIAESIFIFALFFFAVYGFFQLIKLSFHKPVLALIPLAIIGIIAGSSYLIYSDYRQYSDKNSVSYIQDCLAEAAAAKIYGDLGGANADYALVEYNATLAAARIANIRISDDVNEYKKAGAVWASRIRDAAKEISAWPGLPGEPSEFSVKISDSRTKEYLRAAAGEIGAFKEFGDEAMRQKNRDTFKYIAAKLLVYRNWLEGLQYSQKRGVFGFLARPALAYSGESRKICFYTSEGKELCAGALAESIDEILAAAKNLAANKDKADEEWDVAWKNTISKTNLVVPNNVLSEEQAKNKYTPSVQKFVDDCYGVGGVFDTNAVITKYLPTSERGYRCTFKVAAKECWRLLSYSGKDYAGGDSQCPQTNLFSKELANLADNIAKPEPKKAAPAPAKTTAPAKPVAVVWDGNYYTTGTMSCTSDDPTVPASITLDPFVVTVQNNIVVTAAGKSYPISAAGAVSLTNVTQSGAVTTNTKINLQFYKEAGVIKIKGTSTADLSGNDDQGVAHAAHCSGPLSGVPQ